MSALDAPVQKEAGNECPGALMPVGQAVIAVHALAPCSYL